MSSLECFAERWQRRNGLGACICRLVRGLVILRVEGNPLTTSPDEAI